MARTKSPSSPVDLRVISGDARLSPPEYLSAEPWGRFYSNLCSEIIAMRGFVTTADLSLVESATAAARTERSARRIAVDAADAGDVTTFATATKLAQSASREKRGSMAALCLTGDRRGASAARRAGHAAAQEASTRNPPPRPWSELI